MPDKEREYIHKLAETCSIRNICIYYEKWSQWHPNCESYKKTVKPEEQPEDKI